MKITTAELEGWRQQLLFCVLVFTVVLQSPHEHGVAASLNLLIRRLGTAR